MKIYPTRILRVLLLNACLGLSLASGQSLPVHPAQGAALAVEERGPETNSVQPAPAPGVEPQAANDWPQVQKNAQRTGRSNETLGTNFRVAWTRPFQPEKIYPQIQPIAYSGNVYLGSESGNFYALNAATGAERWKYTIHAPILGSAAAGNGLVHFVGMDGYAYGLNATTGAEVWKKKLSQRLGFSTSPVLADGKLMFGGRNGIFYALDPANGALLWQREIGAPLLQTAAWDNGRVIFGAMDMRVYALNSSDGVQVWRSDPIAGMAFKDYWPVIHNNLVLIIPFGAHLGTGGIDPGYPFQMVWGGASEWSWYLSRANTLAQNRGLSQIPEAMNAQASALNAYNANPGNFTKHLYILDAGTGKEAFVVPHFTAQTMHGAVTPPCVDRDGLLIVPTIFIRSGWGRLDLSQRRIVDLLFQNRDIRGEALEAGDTPAGMGNIDETLNVTCTQNLVIAMHTEEMNANYTGAYDLSNRTWKAIDLGTTSHEMSSNTQGGGGNPAVVSNGMIFHVSWNELVARTTQ